MHSFEGYLSEAKLVKHIKTGFLLTVACLMLLSVFWDFAKDTDSQASF